MKHLSNFRIFIKMILQKDAQNLLVDGESKLVILK